MAKGNLNARINLKPITGTADGYLLVVLNGGSSKIRFSTQIRVPIKHWNAEKSELKRSHPDFSSLNEQLRGIVSRTESAVLDLQRQNKAITNEVLKAIVLPDKASTKDAYQHFKELYLSKKKVKAVTLKTLQSSFSQLEQFAKETGRLLDPAQMNAAFFVEWQEYSNDVLGNSNAGYSKKVKDISAFLKWLYDNGHLKQDLSKFAKRPSDKTEIFPLEEKELLILEQAHTKGVFQNQRAEVLRRFLFSCYTGLRYGDLEKIGKQHLHGDSLHYSTKKTTTAVKIPLLAKAKNLLSPTIEGAFFSLPIANQNYNRELKKIFEELEINREIEKPIRKGAEVIRHQLKLSEKISSHDARRTFITLSLQKGMSHWQIMQITGHSNIEMFKRYVRFTDEKVAADLKRCWGDTVVE